MLPDEVLLKIFDFCLDEDASEKKDVEAWQSLVHVCQRWRSVVFGSPRRLNLRLVCQAEIPVGVTLDVWPPLPLIVRGKWMDDYHVDNIISLLKRSNRVCQIKLINVDLPLERIVPEMQEPFPELTHLVLDSYFIRTTALPDSFLGGSAPRLRELRLYGIPFPGLPKLLLSATHLVYLRLHGISHSGNLSPETLVTVLSTLTSLRLLALKFLFSQSQVHPNQASQPPLATRSLLPVLDNLRFEGVTGYLDNLVARIDAPRLKDLVVFFHQNALHDTPQFTQFISRTPTLQALEKAHVTFQFNTAAVKLSSERSSCGEVKVKIPCRELDRQFSSLKRFFTSCLTPLSMSEDLYITYPNIGLRPDRDDENISWLNLLQPFPAVKNLYLCEDIAPHIGLALQELVGRNAREVLPIVQHIFLEGLRPCGSVPEGIEKFIAARQLSGHPFTVSTISLPKRYLMRLMRGWFSNFDY